MPLEWAGRRDVNDGTSEAGAATGVGQTAIASRGIITGAAVAEGKTMMNATGSERRGVTGVGEEVKPD